MIIDELMNLDVNYENLNYSNLEKQTKLTIHSEHFSFETFFTPRKESNVLLIFMSNGGRTPSKNQDDIKTLFHRWSWYNFCEHNVLCVEDPMYKLHPNLSTAWFYGDKNNSCLMELSKIIKRICGLLNIKNNNICFIGSSAGGYCAIYLADILKNSSCFAMNPQIILKNWKVSSKLEKSLSIDLSKKDKFHRNNLLHITTNTKTRFFISCNIKSKKDYDEQSKNLVNALNISKIDYPVTQHNNFTLFLSENDFIYPHSLTFTFQYAFYIINYLISNISSFEAISRTCKDQENQWKLFERDELTSYWNNCFANIKFQSYLYPTFTKNKCIFYHYTKQFYFSLTRIKSKNTVMFHFFSSNDKYNLTILNNNLLIDFSNSEIKDIGKKKYIEIIISNDKINNNLIKLFEIINAHL